MQSHVLGPRSALLVRLKEGGTVVYKISSSTIEHSFTHTEDHSKCTMLHFKQLLAALLLISCSHAMFGYTLPINKREPKQFQESAENGAVASESAVCSRIGVDLIKVGGNAADAVRLIICLIFDNY